MKFLKRMLSALGPKAVESPSEEVQPKDDWATFKRYKGDDFWLVIVDRGLLKNNQLVSMSWISIEYRFLQRQLDNPMFAKPEVMELCYAFEDQLEAAIATIGGKLAAAQTGFGSRTVWFCAPNMLLEAMIRAGAEAFAGFPVDVSLASLRQYENLLPTHLENQLAGNERILMALAEHGDDGSNPRDVMHWVFNSDPEVLDRLASRLELEGYVIEEQTIDKIRFSRLSVLSIEQTDQETRKLLALCQQFGCEYDGWESPVIKAVIH